MAILYINYTPIPFDLYNSARWFLNYFTPWIFRTYLKYGQQNKNAKVQSPWPLLLAQYSMPPVKAQPPIVISGARVEFLHEYQPWSHLPLMWTLVPHLHPTQQTQKEAVTLAQPRGQSAISSSSVPSFQNFPPF